MIPFDLIRDLVTLFIFAYMGLQFFKILKGLFGKE